MSVSTINDQFVRRWELNQRGGFAARLARWRVIPSLALQRLGFNKWVRAPLFFGSRMWLLTGEVTSSGLLAFGYSEVALTALMLNLIKPGMSVIDVGAHLNSSTSLPVRYAASAKVFRMSA